MTPARPTASARLAIAAACLALLLAACGKKGDVTDLRPPPPPAKQPAQGAGG